VTILDILDVANLDWKDTPQADEVKVCCPFCIEEGESPDSRYRLGINVRTGKAHCFNCGWSAGDYVFTARALARIADVDMTGDRVTAHNESSAPVRAKPAPAPVYLSGLPEGYERFSFDSPFERQARDYLMNRGITRDQIDRWEIGFAMAGKYAGRVIIPVVHDKQIAGVACRDYTGLADDTKRMRWMNSESLRGVFGMKGNSCATITEGCMDALRLEPLLPGEDSLCVFGSNISEDQMQFLRRYKRLTYLCDYDKPGCKGARINCAQIAEAGVEILVHVPDTLDGSDPGTQSDELLKKRHRSARLWSKHVERLLIHREAFR
jgi:hypothetical protein